MRIACLFNRHEIDLNPNRIMTFAFLCAIRRSDRSKLLIGNGQLHKLLQ
jgi:hypothetical protein